MTVRSSGNIIRLYLSLLILIGIGGSAFSQPAISGNIKNIRGANKYPHTAVTAIPSSNKMTVSNSAGFAAGDTVLVIQMQGVKIYFSTLLYGQFASQYGQPGIWEFIIVSGVSGNDITFSNNLKNSYDTRGSIQIVKVPYFSNSANVTGKLECDPWDPVTKSGGVLPVIVGNTLTLQADIDVSGLGFRGGAADLGDGICQQTNISYRALYYPATYTDAGYKGSGIANYDDAGVPLFPGHEKGKGVLYTGGGGGNGNYSGGGGGSHRGIGGAGGNENICIPSSLAGGGGGLTVQSRSELQNRIFMGGGGGASTRSAAGTTAAGGNGGGIVIIVANTIKGSGGEILAKGLNGGNGGGTGASGAAGGGAGGTIAISVLNYSGTLHPDVSGGKGGDNIGRLYGEGAGGGGGLVWLTIDNTVNIIPKIDAGLKGISDNVKATDAGNGEKLAGFNPTLNGFLFNSIRSSVTNDQADSTCYNMPQAKIIGTSPVGGTGPYTYKWEVSADIGFTSPVLLTNDADPRNYTPKLADNLILNGNVYFRRTITDSSVPTIFTDISLPFKVKIQPVIQNNTVGPPDTICYAQDPPTVGPMASLTGGNNIYTYKWMVSTVSGSSGFNSPSGNTNSNYTPPPALVLDSWYRRTVTSGRCVDSSGVVKIEVLDNIAGNAVTSALSEEICNGMNFSPVTATITPTITGGDGTYKYKWISSAASWGAAPDAYTNPGYNPVAGSFALGLQVSLRRVIFSGNHDVCKDTTSMATAVKLTRWPVIINNTISADQTIGYDSIPDNFIEVTPPGMSGGAGAGSYNYSWQIGPGWGFAPGTFSLKEYQSDTLKVTSTFRRFVSSSACTSISNTITITVHSKITNNTIALSTPANDTIATGTSPGQLTGTMPTGGSGVANDFSFRWFMKANGTPGRADSIPGARSQNYTPGNLTATGSMVTYHFRREASSPKEPNETSTYKSNEILVVVLPVLANYNLNGSAAKCSGLRPDLLTGIGPVTGGDGKYKYTWQDSTSLHNFADIPGFVKCDSANYKPPVLTTGAAYRRIVYSTANNYTIQSATSNIARVTIYQRPSGSVINAGLLKVCDNGSPTAVQVMISLTPASSPWTVVLSDSLGGTTSHNVTSFANPLIVNPTTTSSKKLRYEIYSVTDVHNCSSPASSFTGYQRVVVYRQPTADAGTDVPQICGANIFLNAKDAIGSGIWTWKKLSTSTGQGNAWFNNANNSKTKVRVDSLSAAWENKNSYRFFWTDINGICPASKDSVNITFDKQVPKPVFSQPSMISSNINRTEILEMPATPVGTGVWGPGSMVREDSVAHDLADGNNVFTFTVTNDACVNSSEFIINWMDIKIPKGFSPNNGDNLNNVFEITGIDIDANEVTLKIINSAGSEVFYADNDNWIFWDGTKNGADAPEGTYYYLLTIISKNPPVSRRDEKGFLILQRKSYK